MFFIGNLNLEQIFRIINSVNTVLFIKELNRVYAIDESIIICVLSTTLKNTKKLLCQ